MIDTQKIKQYFPHALIIIGIIPVIVHALEAFERYALLSKIGKVANVIDKIFFKSVMNPLIENYSIATFGVLITGIIGVAVSIALVIYLARIFKGATKNDFIAVIILGIIAILLNSVVGGILIIIGGVVGTRRLSQ
jgi:hypothetical protein